MITPFGFEVVPEVYKIRAVSSGRIGVISSALKWEFAGASAI